MQTEFNPSRTRMNLMRAFAGECQSRQRYYQAALIAQQQKLVGLERMFRFTAEQEERHAMVFWKLMQDSAGQTVEITAGYPADVFNDIRQLLDASRKEEEKEHVIVYPDFASIADEEGFTEAAQKFRAIAEIENTHSTRFAYYAQLYRDGTLFRSDDTKQRWICLNCGHIHEGSEPPQECPVCRAEQGYFIREEEAAFTSVSVIQK
ncbi:MAG: rubrerythrin family protein [Ruminococcus sp.]|nr:rubrerythrin family protein [Ruminococcus sp.]